MPYPNRTAVIDPITPDVQIILRLYTPTEGPLHEFNGVAAEGVKLQLPTLSDNHKNSRKSGFAGNLVGNVVSADPPDYSGVVGVSKNGWGVANYIDAGSAVGLGGASCVWTNGVVFTAYGGPVREPAPGGAPFGLWLYSFAANEELTSFDGGTVTFTPAYEDIYVDWAVSSFQIEPGSDGYHGYGEAPLSSSDRPAAMQFQSFTLPIDPLALSAKMYGLEMALFASNIEVEPQILFDFPVDDLLDLPNYNITASSFSNDDAADNWMLGTISSFDIDDTLLVLTRFTSGIPMFDEDNDPSVADFNHYIPVIASDTGNLSVWTVGPIAVVDGWLIQAAVSEVSEPIWVLVSHDWSTYQRMSFIGGEQAFCDNSGQDHIIEYLQDTDGTWIALTARISEPFYSEYLMWVEGEMAPGFIGCSGAVSDIPPLPTIVTGDVIIRAWTLSLDGHDMYVLRLGLTETLLYDKYSKEWPSWSSFSNAVWAVNYGFEWLGGVGIGPTNMIVSDDETGALYFLDPEQPYDNPSTEEAEVQEVYFDRIVMGQLALSGREVVPCFVVFLSGDMGEPAYAGAGVTLYVSDDAGKTWTDQGLIEITDNLSIPEMTWTSLGQMEAPGRLFMIIDDGAIARIDGMDVNDEQ